MMPQLSADLADLAHLTASPEQQLCERLAVLTERSKALLCALAAAEPAGPSTITRLQNAVWSAEAVLAWLEMASP